MKAEKHLSSQEMSNEEDVSTEESSD